jgi:hypothetical protein
MNRRAIITALGAEYHDSSNDREWVRGDGDLEGYSCDAVPDQWNVKVDEQSQPVSG